MHNFQKEYEKMSPMISYDGIINQNFIDRLEKDIKKYDILFLCAPFGWGNASILKALCERVLSKTTYWLEETEDCTLEQKIDEISFSRSNIYFIPNLETVVRKGEEDLIWNLLAKKKKGDIFVIASAAMIPAKMLPYTILNRYISYGIDDIRPSNEDVDSYFKNRGISLSQEDISYIEKDCNNLPLFIQLLANLLVNTNRGYTRAVRERCFEDFFTYIDLMFFRRFSEEDQNAMLKLSCLDKFDNKLISYMLDISLKDANLFVERLLINSSILDKDGKNWKFYPMMKLFLERAIHKYLDYEERVEDYQKALKYLVASKKWMPALRFAYFLHDKEEIARCMDELFRENPEYINSVNLEDYFRELSADIIIKYPNLLICGSIIKAIAGDVRAAKRYEKMYLNLLEQTDDEEESKRLKAQLLFMYMSRPGTMRDDILEISAELLDVLGDSEVLMENQKFEPHYVSILRGEKDYCKYFTLNSNNTNAIEKLHEVADKLNDHTYSMLLKFMEAEVYYERNELDRALDALVKITREAKFSGNQIMQQLCMIAMIDLLAAKNQMNHTEIHQLDLYESQEWNNQLFQANCQAHSVFYHLLRNDEEAIFEWMKNSSPDETKRFYTIQYYQYLTKAKIYIWMGQYVRARMILQLLFDYALEYKMSYLEAQIRVLESFIYYKEGNILWKETLIPALEWGRECGFIRVFADEGAAIYEPLNKIFQEDEQWEKDEYLKKVLNAAKAQMLQYPKYLKQEKACKMDDFSESELAVMKLLVLGDKNAEIANRLCVSENTVKYHLKNIFQKLQVKSRSQAIHKIRENNII